jgi:hypothetical protein
MNELTPLERDALATRLRDAVPAAPDLPDLAGGAEARARRTRRTRRTGMVLAAAAAVLVVAVLPRALGGHDDAPAHPLPARCVPDTRLDHQDFRSGTAAWVVPCHGPGGRAFDIPMPPGAVRGAEAEAFVAPLQAKTHDAAPFESCPSADYPGVSFQVGFTDGTVAAVGLSGCRGVVSPGDQEVNAYFIDVADSLSAKLQQANAAGSIPAITGTNPSCPRSAAEIPRFVNAPHASHEVRNGEPVLILPAVGAVVCRFHHGHLLEQARPVDFESLLLASASGWYLHARSVGALAWDANRVPRSTYAVWLVDMRGHVGSFTVTGRYGRVTLYRHDGTYERFGAASPILLHALGRSLRQ